MLYTTTENLPSKYLLEFYSQTCGPCKQIKESLIKLSETADVVMLDAHENIELAMKYQVVTVPTLIMIENGVELGRYKGIMTDGQLRDFYNSSEV